MRRIIFVTAAIGIGAISGCTTPSAPGPHVQGCAVSPCSGSGVPSAAPGGEPGSGPAALRTEPQKSPVATGVGGGSPGS